MDLRRVRYFVAVAEELHFGNAARRLNMAQPPLSQQIKKLEREVGAALLKRTRRSVELTVTGRVFLERARHLLADAAELAEATRRAERGDIGQLTIGFVPSVGYSLLPPIVRTFRDISPGVALTLRELTGPEQAEQLGDGRLDFAFVRPIPFSKNVECEVILQEPFVVALPEEHPSADDRVVSIESLREQPFITFPRSGAPVVHEAVRQLCRNAGFGPRISQEANTIHTALGMVSAGLGVAVVPASAMYIAVPHVTFRPLLQCAPRAEIAIAWRRDEFSPALTKFVETTRTVSREYGERERLVLGGRKIRSAAPRRAWRRSGSARNP